MTDCSHLLFVIDVIITLLLIFWQMLCHVVCLHLLLQEGINLPMADVVAICYLFVRLVLLPFVFSWLMLLPFLLLG